MNKILFNQAHPLDNGRMLVPFACTDANGYALHEPRYNRTEAEDAKAKELTQRIQAALLQKGYTLAGPPNWFSMRLTIQPL
jgi:hypothetical protein